MSVKRPQRASPIRRLCASRGIGRFLRRWWKLIRMHRRQAGLEDETPPTERHLRLIARHGLHRPRYLIPHLGDPQRPRYFTSQDCGRKRRAGSARVKRLGVFSEGLMPCPARHHPQRQLARQRLGPRSYGTFLLIESHCDLKNSGT